MLSRRLAALDLLTVDAADLASIVAEEATTAFGARRAVVWMYRPALAALVLEQRGREIRSLPVGDALEAALRSDELVWQLNGDHGDEEALVESSFGRAKGERPAEILGLPLRRDRGPVGLLLIEGILPDAPLMCTDIVEQAAAVLANHDILAAGRRHEAQLEALYRTAGELSSKLELPAVLEAIVERSRLLVRSAISYIMLVDRERSEIYMRVASGITSPGFARIRLEIGSGLGGMAAQREEPFYTSDYLNDGRFTHASSVDAEVRSEAIRCILGTPLRASDEFLGVLFVADRTVRVFTDADVEILSSLAKHAALAIENATLYERTSTALETVSRANRTVEERNRRLRRLDSAHHRLSEVALAGHGLAGIAAVMSELVGDAHVALLDERHRILASAGEPADEFGRRLAEAGIGRDQAAGHDVRRCLAATARYDTAVLAASGSSRTADRLIVPVVARTELLGTVWAALDPARLAEDQPLIEQAARVAALELLKERSVVETERRLRRELLDELLAERAAADEALPRRARDLGVDLSRPYRLAVCAPPAAATSDREAHDRRVRDEAVAALRRLPWCTFVAERGSRVVALIDETEPEPHRPLARVLESLPSSDDVRAVISPPCHQIGEYRSSFITGTRVLDLFGPRLRQTVVGLEDVRVLMLLFREGGEAEVREFLEARLGPLLRRGASGSELVTTLAAWLDARGSPRRAAEELHVHVNTVYYRLERLRALLGKDFDEPQRALDLSVALLAHRLLNVLGEPSKSERRSLEDISILGASGAP